MTIPLIVGCIGLMVFGLWAGKIDYVLAGGFGLVFLGLWIVSVVMMHAANSISAAYLTVAVEDLERAEDEE